MYFLKIVCSFEGVARWSFLTNHARVLLCIAHDPVGLGNTIRGASGQSGGDVVLVGESVEDLLPADPDLGEVDLFRRAGVSLTW